MPTELRRVQARPETARGRVTDDRIRSLRTDAGSASDTAAVRVDGLARLPGRGDHTGADRHIPTRTSCPAHGP